MRHSCLRVLPSMSRTSWRRAAYTFALWALVGHVQAGVAMNTFTDPRESAFSLKVPAGWKVQGGLFRAAVDDVRVAVEAVSPDGSVHVVFGDANYNFFVSPNAVTDMAGLREWQTYPQRPNWILARYHSGQIFSQRWGRHRLSAACSGITEVATQSRRDLAFQANGMVANSPVPLSFTAGETAFRCTRNDQKTLVAYAIAITGRTTANMWRDGACATRWQALKGLA